MSIAISARATGSKHKTRTYLLPTDKDRDAYRHYREHYGSCYPGEQKPRVADGLVVLGIGLGPFRSGTVGGRKIIPSGKVVLEHTSYCRG